MPDSHFGSTVLDDTGANGANGVSKPAVVMVHGLGGTSNTFEPVMPAVESYRVIRPDLPGAGRSALKPSINSIDGLAKSLIEALNSIQINRVILVAHSMGTLVAQHMALSGRILIDGMVLFGALTEPPEAAKEALLKRASLAQTDGMAGIAAQVANAALSGKTLKENPSTHAFVRESLMRQSASGYSSHCRILAKSKAYPVSDITIPVHLITGSDDVVAPVSMAEKLNTEIPDSNLEVLQGTGHWPTLEAPGECQRALTDALNAFATPNTIERN